MDLVSYLASLGHEPRNVRGNDFWYCSPLREERVPSFKVNRKMNLWYDFGIAQGGNLIDFAILYQGCSVGEFLSRFTGKDRNRTAALMKRPSSYEPDNRIEIKAVISLRSDELLNYLKQRRISVQIADLYCKEVHYRVRDKHFFSIGFPNRSGGFELRNSYFKSSSSPKDISLLTGKSDQILVFEGFMDFLTFRTLHPQLDESKRNFLILNSIALFHRARRHMESHRYAGLYLDHDRAGVACTKHALSLNDCYHDESAMYRHFKDLNDWAMHMGKRPLNSNEK